MAGKTNQLISQAKEISPNFDKREFDVLITSGEQVSCALLAGALNNLGVKSKSWMNWQIPIMTEGDHTNSRIVSMNVKNINTYLSEKGVAVIPGLRILKKGISLLLVEEDQMLLQLYSKNI